MCPLWVKVSNGDVEGVPSAERAPDPPPARSCRAGNNVGTELARATAQNDGTLHGQWGPKHWAGQDSNLDLTDYESAALTIELPARAAIVRERPGVAGHQVPSAPHAPLAVSVQVRRRSPIELRSSVKRLPDRDGPLIA